MFRLILIAAVLMPWIVQASPQTHDGFFFQFSMGYGHQEWTSDAAPSSVFTLEGKGIQTSLRLGWTIVENVVLFGELDISAAKVELPEGCQRSLFNNCKPKDSMGTRSQGFGVLYAVMPVNVLVSASVLWTDLVFDPEFGDRYESAMGLGYKIQVGKEWWISENWGMGIAVNYLTAVVPHEESEAKVPEWSANTFGISGTATFN